VYLWVFRLAWVAIGLWSLLGVARSSSLPPLARLGITVAVLAYLPIPFFPLLRSGVFVGPSGIRTTQVRSRYYAWEEVAGFSLAPVAFRNGTLDVVCVDLADGSRVCNTWLNGYSLICDGGDGAVRRVVDALRAARIRHSSGTDDDPLV